MSADNSRKPKRNPLPWLAAGLVAVLIAIVFGSKLLNPADPATKAKTKAKTKATPELTIPAADQAAIVRYARALLEGKTPEALPPSAAEICGRHVFVNLFRNARRNYLYGISDAKYETEYCMEEALEETVRRLHSTDSWKKIWDSEMASTRVAVSVVTTPLKRIRLAHIPKTEELKRSQYGRVGWRLHSKDFTIGKDGLYLRAKVADKTRSHWAPPIEAIARTHGREDNQVHLRSFTNHHLKKAGIPKSKNKEDKPSVRAYRYRTLMMLEAEPGSDQLPLNPVRGNLPTPRSDADDIYDTATKLTDYLVRVLDEDGKFDYEYYADKDRSSKSYNIVRHAGTTYSLLLSYEYTKDPEYLKAGLLAKDYMVDRLQYKEYKPLDYHDKPGAVPVPFPEADGSVKLLALEMDQKASLGATALALLAFAKIPAAALSPTDAERIRHMVNFAWYLQCESGGFYWKYRGAVKGQCPEIQPMYYPGETLLALNTLYQVNPHPAFLTIAEKSIGFELKRFYDGTWPDHWVMQALNLMQQNMPEKARQHKWADAAEGMADKYLARQFVPGALKPPFPEYAGGYRASKGPPRNTPTGSRSEAVASVYQLLRRIGKTEKAKKLGNHLLAAAHFIRYEMYRPDNMYYLPSPKKSLWGLRGSMIDQTIRIDFNQHAVVGVWGAWEAAINRKGIGWPLPQDAEAKALAVKAARGSLITKPGARNPTY